MTYSLIISVTDFTSLNNVVDFYEIMTYLVNHCEPDLYNGDTPIVAVEHGPDYQYGLVNNIIIFTKCLM